MIRSVLAVAVVLLAFEGHAQAQTADASTYVSSEFKTVATRVFGQLTADALAGACSRKQRPQRRA
jgi:outer membrane lipoprotein SlyB